MMDIDSIFAEAGDFGRQQRKYVAIINLVHLYLAINVFNYAIVARNTDFYCVTGDNELSVNTCPEDTGECTSFKYYGATLNTSRLQVQSGSGVSGAAGFHINAADQESKGTGITNAKESIHTSIISEWNLVCDRAWLKPLTMSIFMFCLLLGTAIFGNFSDRIGRKPVLIFVTISLIACVAVCSFVQTFELYCLFRGVCGYFLGGNVTVSYVFYYELIGTTKRNLAGFLMQASYSIGIMLVATLGYFVAGWRHVTLTTALLGIPIALILFYLPESPRWLVTKQRYEQADAVMTQIIVGNGGKYRDAYRQTPPAQTLAEEDEEPALDLDYSKRPGGANSSRSHLADVFGNKLTRDMFLSSLCGWFVCGLGYYVLTFASAFGADKHNFYTSLALSGLVEIPGAALSMFLMGYSRRITVSFTFITWGIVGLLSPLSIAIPELKSTFLFYCKSAASAAFTLMFVCTSEVLPTKVRNTGVGLASTAARVGCIIAPFFYRMNTDVPEVSTFVLGVIALAAGVLWIHYVPETVDKSLPESIADVIKLKNETIPVRDVLWKSCCQRDESNSSEDVRYSMLNQSDSADANFGKENFDNVNFDYDDFNSSDEEISTVLPTTNGSGSKEDTKADQAKSIA